jgi:hypothetical protein
MDFENAYELFKTLCKESMWSKCIYLYQQAISLYTTGKQEDMDRVVKMMKKIPKLTQKIAGKSIPLEVILGFMHAITVHIMSIC